MSNQDTPTDLRASLVQVVETRAAGAPEAQRRTYIECFCDGHIHRRDDFDDGCFCPACAAKEAVRLGYPPTDTEPEEAEGPDDGPRWCETCGCLITLRSTPELSWGITPDGALEELEHYETGLGAQKGEPKTPGDWRVFLLLVDSIADEHLPRVERIVNRGAK